MKVKKTVTGYQCDFCEKERYDVCVVCNKDICQVHSAMIVLHEDPFHAERICFDHFTEDVKQFIKKKQH